MKIFWIILAAACGVMALFFAFRENYENAFVAAAGGAVCWILNYRQQLRESLARHDEPENEEPDEEVRS